MVEVGVEVLVLVGVALGKIWVLAYFSVGWVGGWVGGDLESKANPNTSCS